jgi:hypothetical protein
VALPHTVSHPTTSFSQQQLLGTPLFAPAFCDGDFLGVVQDVLSTICGKRVPKSDVSQTVRANAAKGGCRDAPPSSYTPLPRFPSLVVVFEK